MEIWDLDGGAKLQTIRLSGGAQTAALSPDGRRLAVSDSYKPIIHLFDAESGEEEAVLEGHNRSVVSSPLGNRVNGLDFSPDGRFLVSVGDDARAVVWDLDTYAGESLMRHEYVIWCVRFSHSGGRFATGGAEPWSGKDRPALIGVREVGTEGTRTYRTGGSEAVELIAYCGDDTAMVAACRDATVWICSGDTEARPVEQDLDTVLALSPDATTLAAENDGTLEIWDISALVDCDVKDSYYRPPKVARLKAEGDLQGLLRVLARDDRPNERAAAARVLGEMGDVEAVEPLIGALKDRSAIARKNAAIALGQIRSSKAVESLIGVLDDESFAVGTAAALALGEIGDERAVEPLAALQDDSSTYLRHAAGKGLRQFVPAYEVDSRLEKAERASTTPEERIAKGIRLLEELCSSTGSTGEDGAVQRAVDLLEPEGASGAEALVSLIEDLLACRSPRLGLVLQVAGQLEPAQALVDVVWKVKTADELAPKPAAGRFTPEIVGGGQVGWTTGTAEDIRGAATRALEKLTGVVVDAPAIARPGADLEGADLAEAEFGQANLKGANLRGANLRGATLRHAELTGADLESADLRGANLYFADLSGANLEQADLRDANLYMADLTDAIVTGAGVAGANVQGGATMPDGRRSGRLPDLEEFTRGPAAPVEGPSDQATEQSAVPGQGQAQLAVPIEALRQLRGEVADLAERYPANQGGAGVPRAEAQIPWICRTLKEAADALETKRDPFGNPITQAQVVGGLVKLTQMVEEPSYIAQMEMVNPGIGKSLEGAMEKVHDVILSLRLADNGDGTVTDIATGLMWQKADESGERKYGGALIYCQMLDLAGHDDWRLPQKEELARLATVGYDGLKRYFPGIQAERYWAETTADELGWAEAPDRIAYTVDFDPASSNYGRPVTYFRTYSYFVRAVRSD
ncbi:MAG: HEAT repeat domain-containing protein [Chloroflexota bacterium]